MAAFREALVKGSTVVMCPASELNVDTKLC